jgi:hypothetical protein
MENQKIINLSVSYLTEAIRLEPIDEANSFSEAVIGEALHFVAACDKNVTPIVTYDNEAVLPINGVYTITVREGAKLSVNAKGITPALTHLPGVGLNGEDLTSYNQEVFMKNIWEGDTVYHEAVMFANTTDGTVQTTKKLLYPIDDIISVRNCDLNVWYVKGVDFDVKEGKLVWLEGGKCPIWTGPFIVPQNAEDEYLDPALAKYGKLSTAGYYTTDNENGLYLIFDPYHEQHTIYVTYKHSKTWKYVGEVGYEPHIPKNQSHKMKTFYDKLNTKEEINVLVYGASTATGCASTGARLSYEIFSKEPDPETGEYKVISRNEIGYGISAPTFFEQATAKLVKDYGNGNNINYYNIACGGTGAAWGARELLNRVEAMNKFYGKTVTPDIIYVKFAGNDPRTAPESYRTSLTSITNDFRKLYPNAVIVLIAGKINNEKTYIYGDYHDNMLALEQVLEDIAVGTENTIVAKTTTEWDSITKSKDVEDYLSNNINHANDFWAKTAAQIIVASAKKK